ncbi:MAG TPA: hypothetical protein VEA79_12230 [Phenylobacterium sp.]|nr:hypothetical protein [Phenylobacterium sp.]
MSAALPAIRQGATAGEACEALREAGWREVGRGDWCWVFADPSDETAARVTPWDRAYRLHVKTCLAHAGNPFLQRIDGMLELAAGGHVVFMERLWPPDEAEALAFCHAVRVGNDSGWDWTRKPAGPFPETPALEALRAILVEELAEGAATLPFWGGSDVGPKNVMADTAGQLKLIDPIFVNGWKIVEAIEQGSPELTARLTWPEMEGFFSIPRALENPDEQLVAKARALFATASAGAKEPAWPPTTTSS